MKSFPHFFLIEAIKILRQFLVCYRWHLEPDPADLMDFGHTADNGSFFLQGYETEFSIIDPVLTINHRCNDGGIVRIFITI